MSRLARLIGRGVVACVLVAASTAAAAPQAASAAPAPLAISTLTPEVTQGEGGASKLELSFTNLTTAPAVLEAKAEGQEGCKLGLSTNQLAPAQITAVTIELPKACVVDDSLRVQVNAALPESGVQSFTLDPKGSASAKPDWHQLWAFGVALLLGLALFGALYLIGWEYKGEGSRSLATPLKALDATWKFNDNWATNATAAGALLTGLFSATTAKAFLGPNAEALTALDTVGAAVALAFVAAAPIFALATKSYKGPDDTRGDAFTVGGVLAAATLIVAGAAGQLWVFAHTASKLGLGSAGFLVWVAAGLAAALLVLYAWRTLKDLLERGTDPTPPDPDVQIEAATLIVKAIEAVSSSGDKKQQALAALNQSVQVRQAAAVEHYRQRPRSALI